MYAFIIVIDKTFVIKASVTDDVVTFYSYSHCEIYLYLSWLAGDYVNVNYITRPVLIAGYVWLYMSVNGAPFTDFD